MHTANWTWKLNGINERKRIARCPYGFPRRYMRFVNTMVMNHPDSISFSLRIASGFERSLGFFDMTEEFWGLRSDYLPRVLYLFRRVIESDNNRVRHGETYTSSEAQRAGGRRYYIVNYDRYLETTQIRTPCRCAFTRKKSLNPKFLVFSPVNMFVN